MRSAKPIVSFYREEGTDDAGRKLSQILAWDSNSLERYHDFIQWLFPLTERSSAVPDAPILQPVEIQEFNADQALQGNLLAAFKRMLNFYGFDYSEDAGKITISRQEGWSTRKPHWLNRGNHNHLRITRILKSLTILGLKPQATAFFEALQNVYRDYRTDIGSTTFQYWKQAAE